MNTQEAYELMRIYLTRPGARQAKSDLSCMYETEIEGALHRCAVGCLLTAQSLSQVRWVEDNGAGESEHVALRHVTGGLATLCAANYILPELDDVNWEFLEAAQHAHDTDRNWEEGYFKVEALDSAAERSGLTVVVDERQGAPLVTV